MPYGFRPKKRVCRYTSKPGGCANPQSCTFHHPVCERVTCTGYSDGCGRLHPLTFCRYGGECYLNPDKGRKANERICTFQHDISKAFCRALFCGDDCDELCGMDHRCPDEIYFKRPCQVDPASNAVCLYHHRAEAAQEEEEATSEPLTLHSNNFDALTQDG